MARTTGSAPERTEAPAKAPGVTRLVTYNVGVFNKYIRDDYRLVADMMREIGAMPSVSTNWTVVPSGRGAFSNSNGSPG